MNKNFYALILSSLCFVTSFAQKTTVVSKQAFHKQTLATNKNGLTPSPTAIAGDMVCHGYMASMTQTLDITLNVNNPDLEYVDSLSITFPAGITPISSPNATFPTINNNGGFCNYNGVVGQTISWGENNNDYYGGVYGNNLNFQVVVSIGALSGPVTGTFHLSGDGFFQNGPSVDKNGTFLINPKAPVDFRVIDFSIPYVGCLNTNSEWIGIKLRNDGYNAATGTTTLSYQINSTSAVVETTVATIAPNDTLSYVFSVNGNFSALTSYTVKATAANSLDADASNNTVTRYTQTFPKYNLPYHTSCEAPPSNDLLNWYGQDADSPYSWDTTDITPHSGRLCFRMLETTPTTCEDWLYSPCLNMETGKTYQLSYWTRLTSGYVGSFGSFLLTAQIADSIKQVLQSPDTLSANSVWKKDTVNFTVSHDGVYHIGFLALNYTEEIIAMRLDDISIIDFSTLNVGSYTMDEISVYPNPTKDNLTIYSPNSILTIELYNAVGQTVISNQTTQLGKNQLDISDLPTGVYMLKLSNNRNIAYRKIIKQ